MTIIFQIFRGTCTLGGNWGDSWLNKVYLAQKVSLKLNINRAVKLDWFGLAVVLISRLSTSKRTG
jgi:hypothetical protein